MSFLLGPFENIRLPPELRRSEHTADSWDCCMQFATKWGEPDLPKDQRMESEDEADGAKSRAEQSYPQ